MFMVNTRRHATYKVANDDIPENVPLGMVVIWLPCRYLTNERFPML